MSARTAFSYCVGGAGLVFGSALKLVASPTANGLPVRGLWYAVVAAESVGARPTAPASSAQARQASAHRSAYGRFWQASAHRSAPGRFRQASAHRDAYDRLLPTDRKAAGPPFSIPSTVAVPPEIIGMSVAARGLLVASTPSGMRPHSTFSNTTL